MAVPVVAIVARVLVTTGALLLVLAPVRVVMAVQVPVPGVHRHAIPAPLRARRERLEYKLYFNLASRLYGWGVQLPVDGVDDGRRLKHLSLRSYTIPSMALNRFFTLLDKYPILLYARSMGSIRFLPGKFTQRRFL